MTPEELVTRAKNGDAAAVEALLTLVKDDVYRLALRMLGLRADAEDATQEILIKVLTHLSEFRGESAFRTWVYTIAVRYLMRAKRGLREELASFETLDMLVARGEERPPMPELYEAELALLALEVRLTCTSGVLLSLDREQRMSYILAEVFELSSEEASAVLEIESATHRKRLSRARERLGEWMSQRCSLVIAENDCNCRRQVPVAMSFGVAKLDALNYADHPEVRPTTRRSLPLAREASEIEAAALALRDHPEYAAPIAMVERIRALISSGRLPATEGS